MKPIVNKKKLNQNNRQFALKNAIILYKQQIYYIITLLKGN